MIWDEFIKPWVTIAKGSAQTFKQLVSPPVTIKYPYEERDMSPRWRGPLRLRGVMEDHDPPVTDAPPLEFNRLMNEKHAEQKVAPCMGGCPANVDARGQNALVAAGRAVEAYSVVRRRNVMPGVLGYVCNNPCEPVCRRSYFEEPIAIRQLHRECYEVYDREARYPGHLESLVTRDEHVAVIGAGPAGLAAAYDLVQIGYRVTIYERERLAGGLLVTGIPLYRLDREVVANEIRDLEEMGIEVRTGVNVGTDVTLSELREKHDAVIIAVGYSAGRIVPLPGSDAEGVWSALDFLHSYCMGEECSVGPDVVTIGGGDVGCDCSRSALRCGAERSIQATRETWEEMPAQDIEALGAVEERVEFMHRWEPERIHVEGGRVAGIRLNKIAERIDADGRPRYEHTGEAKDIPCNTIIFAIGQALDLDFLRDQGVELDPRGRPIIDEATGESSVPGLFFAGDIVTGPKTIIIAMGQAHETAISVHRHLQGKDIRADRDTPVHPPEYYLKNLYAPSQQELMDPENLRVKMPEADPDARRHSNMQVERGWPKGDGHREAIRCMRCQTHYCVACTLCARICPDNCIDVQGHDTGYVREVTRYDFMMEWCCFCGLCQDICPTQTLSLAASFDYSSTSRRDLFYDTEKMLRKYAGPEKIVNKDGWP